jgi:hypothetical protein
MEDLHIKPNEFVTATDVRKWMNDMLHPHIGKPLAITTINRDLADTVEAMPKFQL